MASPSSSPQPPPPSLPLPAPPPPSQSQSQSPSRSPSPCPSLSPKPETLFLPAPESKPSSPPKKPQPLPWSHQETVALIQSYQDKWYSLKKGQLKAFQWEEVSVGVAARCGFDSPSKTATQCRHKIEKLRKRYRSELKKRHPSSWQYLELMDQMERGPMPLEARPIAAVKSSISDVNANLNNNSIHNTNTNNINHNYSSLYSGTADYYNNSRGDGGGSEESDEEWTAGYGVETAKNNKSKSINNILLGDVKRGVRSVRRVTMERGFSGGADRFARVLRNQMNGKRKQYYDGDDSDEEEDEEDGGEEEQQPGMAVEEGEDGGGSRELAAEIRGFAERFMRMENKKIEMMRETERYRMEMEKKRMEMILDAQRKIVDTIGMAFKKAKMAQES